MAAHDTASSQVSGPQPAAGREPAGQAPTPKVVLHIGEPKTGTTFLQQVTWRNRGELAARGIVLAGHHPQDHFRASQDLRGIPKLPSDPVGSWNGEWEILARQAQQAYHAGKVAIISHELIAAADPEQAERALRPLLPAQVHLVLSVRDFATLLPAEWQETVKHRNARQWEDWLADVIDREAPDEHRRRFWFWRVHDTLAILGIWSRLLPSEQVHVMTMPPRGSRPGLLWERFASVLGIDPAGIDTSRARPNSSLGLAETEFLRRFNQVLSDEVPDWFYMWNVKEPVAHTALANRPVHGRLVLPAEREPWVKEQAALITDALRTSGYQIIGDLDELQPRLAPEWTANTADQPTERVLDAAVDAAAALVLNQYRKAFPAAKPQRYSESQRGLVGRVESTVAASPRIKRTMRELSSRSRTIRRMRILAWQLIERRRGLR